MNSLQAEVDHALRLAAVSTYEQIRCDQDRCPAGCAAFFARIELELFAPDFDVEAAWRGTAWVDSALATADPAVEQRATLTQREQFEDTLDVSPRVYVETLRIETARRMLELSDHRIPTGCVAAAVGIEGFPRFRRAWERCAGPAPRLVRLPLHLRPRFDAVVPATSVTVVPATSVTVPATSVSA